MLFGENWLGQVENSETSETSSETPQKFFYNFFSSDFLILTNTENRKLGEEENSEKKFWGFWGFQCFRVFDLPVFRFFNQVSQISDRFIFFKLCDSFVFISYFGEICYSMQLWAVIIQHANTCSKSHEWRAMCTIFIQSLKRSPKRCQ